MSLVDRARAALWSNLNGIVSRLERPGADIAALLQQMGEEINKAKRELIRVMGEEKVLRERSKLRFDESQKWQSRAELAVKAQNDGLARDALAQSRRLQGESARDATSADEYGALAQSIRADVAQMEHKHRDWAARKHTIATQIQQARAGGGVEALGAKPGSNAFTEFSRAEQAIERAEDEVQAGKELEGVLAPSRDLEQQFEALESAATAPTLDEAEPAPHPEKPSDPTGKPRLRVK